MIDHLDLKPHIEGSYWKSKHLPSGDYGLLSEAVTPSFDYQDMTLATIENMRADYPGLWPSIARFCKG